MRVLIVALAILLAVPSLGLARPRKRHPRRGGKAALKAPARGSAKGAAKGRSAGDVRGAVKSGGRKRPAAGGAEAEHRKAGREHDPRLDSPAKDGAPVGGGNPALQRGTRLEFDGRLVQGQTARSGAVYLFERARSQLRSMVRERQSYRDEIVRTVYEQGGKR